MKGFIRLTPLSLMDITNDCCVYIRDFDLKSQPEISYKEWSWLKMRNIEKHYFDAPHWYAYKAALIRHMNELHQLAEQANKNSDEIWLSELSYKNMVLLKNGDKYANPVYIMSY